MHTYTHRIALTLLLSIPLAAGCDRNAGSEKGGATADTAAAHVPATATSQAVAPIEAPAAARRLTACELVTAAEMSKILGQTVEAKDDEDGEGDSACRYVRSERLTPEATLSVSWEGGEPAMMAVGMMGRIEPGIANPYEGIGDQAALVGPMLMIRSGDHLLQLMLPGADDVPAAAKQVVDVASGRM